MENNINKYLHKKFKKQFGEIRSSNHHHYQQNSIESNGIVNTTRENIKEEEKKSSTNVNSTIQDEEQQQHQNQSKRGSDSIATTIDNNNSNSSGSGSSCNVPNESSSTNNNNNLLLCTVNSNEKSSISSPLSTVTATTTTTTVALPAASSLSSSSTLDTTLPTGTAVTVVSSASTNVIKVNVIKKNEQSHHHHLNSDELKDEGSNSATNDARRTLCSEIIADSTAAAIKEPQTKNGSISSIFSKVEGQIINDKSNDINFDTNFKSTEPKHAKSSTTTTTALQDNERTITIITTAAGATATTTTTTAHHVVAQKENNLIPYYVNATTTVEDVSVGAIGTYDALKLKYVSMVNETNQIAEKSASGKYVCSYCNLVCSKPSVLQKHIRAHTNERPYPCESCGSRFKTRSNLYKHCRSRTHANRVMGNNNKSSTTTASENNNDADNVDNQMKYDYYNGSSKMTIGEMNEMNVRNSCKIDNSQMAKENSQQQEQQQQQMQQSVTIDAKPKPYKPRFHTKSFYDNLTKENAQQEDQTCAKPINSTSSSSVLMSRADEPIARIRHAIKNNYYTANNNGENNNNNNKPSSNHAEPYHDEPLNLSSKSRKRCLSEVAEPTTQKSLIKELLLKNLYASADMQCPNCKMIFQTVTELDVHKHRSNCKGYSKTGARYNRSSSVNVASILTQNKNAFDGIPQLQEAFFPLKSPGPFLGKTRLIESDKSKSFSFDDGIQNTQNDFFRGGGVVGNYKNLSSIDVSPKRPAPVKLFGGEVKITHASGETKSFIVDGKESSDGCFMAGGNAGGDYNAKLSENTVVKSVLQSGGTVLQNKTGYNSGSSSCTNNNKKQLLSPVDALNYHHAKPVSPNYHAETGNKYATANEIGSNNINVETHISTEYTSIVDFSQKAVKSFTPNLKQLNLTIPGVPVPNILPQSSTLTDPCAEAQIVSVIGKQHDQREKPIEIAKDFRLRNPMTLLVNGKFVPYVPGMPGPITAEVHLDSLYHNGLQHQQTVPIPTFKLTPPEQSEELLAGGRAAIVQNNTYAKQGASEHKTTVIDQHHQSVPMVVVSQQVPMDVTQSPTATDKLLMVDTSSSSPKKIAKPSTSPLATTTVQQQETPKRFARPNSLALKPTMASMKQHHGLTPTVFNQILISPDTPRVAKKYIEYQRNGYYFSSLGLKSSTKSVYCTLNKTQPYYVPHYKKLSMYSEWRQQDTKTDKLYVSVYDSRQRPQKYTLAGQICQPHVVHSSYKFIVSRSYGNDDGNKVNQQIAGGHESNENYTYVRGRGRGRYVCDQCGIRCKKPSMLKKHIRTHTNDRPYTCNQCNFSFKTKGNLTKHMKCKSHNKNYYASSSCSSGTFNQPNSEPTSESETDDSGMDSSDESTRQHEAAYGLLSLSQKPSRVDFRVSTPNDNNNIFSLATATTSKDSVNSIMDNEEIVHVSKQTFAKNKILDQEPESFSRKFSIITPVPDDNDPTITTCNMNSRTSVEYCTDAKMVNLYLGKSNVNRPLTYPYTSPLIIANPPIVDVTDKTKEYEKENYASTDHDNRRIDDDDEDDVDDNDERMTYESSCDDPKEYVTLERRNVIMSEEVSPSKRDGHKKMNYVFASTTTDNNVYDDHRHRTKRQQKQDDAMDLSVNSSSNKENGDIEMMELETDEAINYSKTYPTIEKIGNGEQYDLPLRSHYSHHYQSHEANDSYPKPTVTRVILQNGVDANYTSEDSSNDMSVKIYKRIGSDYDNSAMETLADIATKQMKLERNSVAKNVATEFLKLATKNDGTVLDSLDSSNFIKSSKDVNDLIAKREENKSCTICLKNFNKPSQLRLHMNIHYLERPFRCDSCSVGFRTKGLLQKHERSAGHHNKLSTSPALSSSEPRPFKCGDCSVAFRIHGHLAKHLRSKMHIMKLECLAKIPFGLYAELERSNSLLTEINTSDGEQCLESLKSLAKKVFDNDPNKLNQSKEDRRVSYE